MRTRACPGWLRAALVAPFAALVLSLALPAARADFIILKDGYVLQGKVKREHSTLFDEVTKEPILVPKGFFMIYDGARKVYFSPSQVRVADNTDPPNEEKIVAKYNKFQVNPRHMPALLGVLDAPHWDHGWERHLTIRTPDGAEKLPQHIGGLTPYWARADSMGKYFWSAAYLTRELGPKTVSDLLATHPDFQEPRGMADAERARRRWRLCDFYVQAGWFDYADQEMDRMLIDLPGEKERVAARRAKMAELRARDLFETIKRLHGAGQPEAVRQRLARFPEKDAPEQILADVRELRSECAATALRKAECLKLLEGARGSLTGNDSEPLGQAADALLKDLQVGASEVLPRLEAFLGQARQAERERKNGRMATVSPAELVSLAVTGWLAGSTAAEKNPATALRLWRGREMLLAALRLQPDDQDGRQRLLDTFQRNAKSEATLDELLQLVPQLPPPEPLEKITTDPVEMQAEIRLGGVLHKTTYSLQLPPEYRPVRSYPVLVVLHESGEKPQAMLRRWADAAAENGYVLVAPEWEKSVTGQYGYSVEEHATVLAALRDLRRRVQIDSDRIFLFGLGEGGTMAFDFGLAHPDLFAGVIPMAGKPDLFSRSCWRNAQYLPFYVVGGNKAGETSKSVREQFENWIQRCYPSLWIEYQGRGIEWFGGEVPFVFDWMRTKQRNFPMQQLGSDGNGGQFGNEFCTMRPSDNRFYWLSTDSIGNRHLNDGSDFKKKVDPATMTARIDPQNNDVFVRTSGLNQVTVWLGRNAKGTTTIDFDKPVKVHVGFTVVWARKVTPSLAVLLEDLVQRGDRQMLFVAKIAVSLK
jgi:pimeloyl-ACP methyl ester carboxylesterase